MMLIAVLTTVVAAVVFSGGFLWFLGLKIIRTSAPKSKADAVFIGVFVMASILTALLFFEALLFFPMSRDVAGRFVYAGTGSSVLLLVVGSAQTLGVRGARPIEVALAHRTAVMVGLIAGNFLLVASHVEVFARYLPSFL